VFSHKKAFLLEGNTTLGEHPYYPGKEKKKKEKKKKRVTNPQKSPGEKIKNTPPFMNFITPKS